MKAILILIFAVYLLFAVYVFAGGLNMTMQMTDQLQTAAPPGSGPVGDGVVVGVANDYVITSPDHYVIVN